MALAVLRRFFNFWEKPWFVSPVRVPCEACAKYKPPFTSSTNCRNSGKHNCDCAAKAEESEENLPRFEKHDEPSSIQLFYDLFFVANLSACTQNHQIFGSDSLKTYIGFFTLMWFTWFGAIIFDVRFAIDSWFMRLNKACSFGIMTFFAMSSIYLNNPDKDAHFGHDARMISLILMVSRMLLVIEYGAILIAAYHRYQNKSVVVPFALTMFTSLVAAFAFLGLSYDNSAESKPYGNIGWYVALPPMLTGKSVMLIRRRYVTSVSEATVHLIISYIYPAMFFDKSNIVERMGALTLIIMGEGIIGMTEAVSNMFSSSSHISSQTGWLVVAAVLIIYVIWMLYFDHTDKLDHPGGRINKQGPWCQIWTFLHFPLHVAILLTLEGSAKFTLWWNANEAFTFIDTNFDSTYIYSYNQSVLNGTYFFQKIQSGLDNIIDRYYSLDQYIKSEAEFQNNLTIVQNLGLISASSEEGNAVVDMVGYMENYVLSLICTNLGIDVPPAWDDNKIVAIFGVFMGWFITFFVAAGVEG
jgi:low temperature requirement protein LtrA